MADRKLFCKDCGNVFVFTEGEQKFFADKGIKDDPIRCPECRKAKKQRMENKRKASDK